MNTTIQFVQSELGNILKDVAKIHLISAEQAFIAADRSNNSESETRAGIGHLRDAFNSFQIYLEKGETFLGIFRTSWNAETKTSIQLKLASLAFVIALIYKRLDDESNYLSWKITGFEYAKTFILNREKSVAKWKNAQTIKPGTPNIPIQIVQSEYYLLKYKNELVFIELFSKVIDEV